MLRGRLGSELDEASGHVQTRYPPCIYGRGETMRGPRLRRSSEVVLDCRRRLWLLYT
jgi:hypothetical protein